PPRSTLFPYTTLFRSMEGDLDRGVDEDRAEDEQHPAEAVDQGHARQDQRAAQDERAQHAPEKDAVLELPWDGEALEQQDEHEQVVDGKAFFQQVPGEELEACFCAVSVPQVAAERERQDDPQRAPGDRRLEPFAVTARPEIQV